MNTRLTEKTNEIANLETLFNELKPYSGEATQLLQEAIRNNDVEKARALVKHGVRLVDPHTFLSVENLKTWDFELVKTLIKESALDPTVTEDLLLNALSAD